MKRTEEKKHRWKFKKLCISYILEKDITLLDFVTKGTEKIVGEGYFMFNVVFAEDEVFLFKVGRDAVTCAISYHQKYLDRFCK